MNVSQADDLWTAWQPTLVSFGIFLGVIVLGLICYQVIYMIFAKSVNRTKNIWLTPMVRYWHNPLRIIFMLFIINLMLPVLIIPPNYHEIVQHILVLILIGSIGWLAVKTVHVMRDIIIARQASKEDTDSFHARSIITQTKVLERIAVVLVSVVAVAGGLMTFPKIQQLGVSLLASAGIAGVIIGFAAQKSLTGLLAGIQIAFTQPIRIGDVLIINDDFGTVEEITLTYVVLRVWDKRRWVIPISYFIENSFQNWTRTSKDLLGTVYIYVDYSTSVEDIRSEFNRILDETELWDRKSSGILVTGCTSDVVEVRAMISAPDAGKLWDLRCLVREKLLAWLQKAHPESLPRTRVDIKSTA